MLEFVSCIKDECGDVVMYTSDMTREEIDKILEEHEEWSSGCVEIK